jgi:hypothetical protein
MNTPSKTSSKPPLYRGHPLPLGELSSDSFEDFVYQALTVLGEQKGFQMESGRQPSGDQGFDCMAKVTSTNDLICIQCKRYSSALSVSTVAEEIIKVALNGALDNSTPQHHYIITSGTVSTKLRTLLRQRSYSDLKVECKTLLGKQGSQNALIKRASEAELQPYDVVCAYIESLDNLIVWSGLDFQNELVVIWSKLTDVLSSNFSLEIALKESPTPDFNVLQYFENIRNNCEYLVPLQYTLSQPPIKLSCDNTFKVDQEIILSTDNIRDLLLEGNNIVLSSSGGSGKSSTLSILERDLISSIEDIQYVPIRINLRSYSRNTLKDRIQQELGINYGSWSSLPFKYIFLLDALDEMLQHDTQAFLDELRVITKGHSYIITLRNSGLDIESKISGVDSCITVLPLSYRSAFKIAEKTFSGDELRVFYDEYRKRLSSIGFNFLSSPFVLSMTIEHYRNEKNIPSGIEEILEGWVRSKIKHDGRVIKSTSINVNKIPVKFVVDAFSLILYKCKVEKNLSSIPEDVFYDLMVDCYDELDQSKSFIARSLDLNEFLSMISHYELLVLGSDGHYSTPHTIISEYLISKALSKNWRKHIDTHLLNSFENIWMYVSGFIEPKDQEEFVDVMLSFDSYLGTKISKRFNEIIIASTEFFLLEMEQSNKVLARSNAIFSLGLLATDDCLKRLRSTSNCLDQHHSWQRQCSLAIHGDEQTLRKILRENERQVQAPMQMSGGTYEIWFSAPPAIITEMARARLERWVLDKTVPLCMSLQTIERYGDSYDVEILINVIEDTDQEKEFYIASNALRVIDNDSLIEVSGKLIESKDRNSFLAKNVLLSYGVEFDIEEELNIFIGECSLPESQLAEKIYGVCKLVEFIEKFVAKFDLNESQEKLLVETYNGLKFSHDLYIYWLFWRIAAKGKMNVFLSVVESVFESKEAEEVNQALYYLSCLDELDISTQLSEKIDVYYLNLKSSSYDLRSNYARYYLKHDKKEMAFEIIAESVKGVLEQTTPETITHDSYITSLISHKVFGFFDIATAKKISIDTSLILKFLLVDASSSGDEIAEIKNVLVGKVSTSEIEGYIDNINDESVKLYVYDYLLKNDFVSEPINVMRNYLPYFFSHHRFYPTIINVCKKEWSNELADLFLSSFVDHDWSSISCQMFDEYTGFYADLLSSDQLKDFERTRNKPVKKIMSRTYNVWLEHHGLENI